MRGFPTKLPILLNPFALQYLKFNPENLTQIGTVCISSRVNFIFGLQAFTMKGLLSKWGGLELLCDSVKIHNINVDPQDGEKQLTMKNLLTWVRTNLIKERPEMFMKGDSVRPGVLVLVNDTDWELSGQLETVLEEKDNVVFISTLHGG
uniref:Ubiquitin-related modifier 1 homolog n=1 Tax=Nicotiana tabacum TaxID=4097 RepID=A0A1S4D7I6_TOBAC|nr:PREDICTED: ubiquitin-related modifier 1 homolog 2-like isoform X1 [Nicotiana tabacum]